MARMPKRIRVSAPDAFSRHRPKPKSIISCGWGRPPKPPRGPPPAGAGGRRPRGPARLLCAREPLAARQFLVQQRRLAPELLDRLPSPCVDALKHAVGLAPADALRAWSVGDPRDLVLEGGAHRQARHAEAPRPPPPPPRGPRAPGAPPRAAPP